MRGLPGLNRIGGKDFFEQSVVIGRGLNEIDHDDFIFGDFFLTGDDLARQQIVRPRKNMQNGAHL